MCKLNPIPPASVFLDVLSILCIVLTEVLETLNSIDGQLEGVLDNLPVGTINDFGDQIDSLGDSIADALGTYNNDYDVYRYSL